MSSTAPKRKGPVKASARPSKKQKSSSTRPQQPSAPRLLQSAHAMSWGWPATLKLARWHRRCRIWLRHMDPMPH